MPPQVDRARSLRLRTAQRIYDAKRSGLPVLHSRRVCHHSLHSPRVCHHPLLRRPVPYATLIFQALMSVDSPRVVFKDSDAWFEKNTDKAKDPALATGGTALWAGSSTTLQKDEGYPGNSQKHRPPGSRSTQPPFDRTSSQPAMGGRPPGSRSTESPLARAGQEPQKTSVLLVGENAGNGTHHWW